MYKHQSKHFFPRRWKGSRTDPCVGRDPGLEGCRRALPFSSTYCMHDVTPHCALPTGDRTGALLQKDKQCDGLLKLTDEGDQGDDTG